MNVGDKVRILVGYARGHEAVIVEPSPHAVFDWRIRIKGDTTWTSYREAELEVVT